MAKSSSRTLKIKCGGLGPGKKRQGLGIIFDRKGPEDLIKFDGLLTNASLDVKMFPSIDNEDQKELFDEKNQIEFSCEVDSMKVYSDHIACKLSIHRDVLTDELLLALRHKFENRVSKAAISRTGEATGKDKEKDEDVVDEHDEQQDIQFPAGTKTKGAKAVK